MCEGWYLTNHKSVRSTRWKTKPKWLTRVPLEKDHDTYKIMAHLWKLGYSSEDIVTSIFRVCKTHNLPEYLKLEFIKEIGLTHLALVQGTQSLLQLSGMLARLCQVSLAAE